MAKLLTFAFDRNYRFPCSVADCKKEYRTQWELNNHCRTKHRNDKVTQVAKDKNITEFPVTEQTKSDPLVNKKSTPAKTRNRQKIIYVLPGPQSNYVRIQTFLKQFTVFQMFLLFLFFQTLSTVNE